MEYYIKNNKNIYIRLNANGTPITCTEKCKGVFEYSKAYNIVKNLPKNLRKEHFKVECSNDIHKNKNNTNKNDTVDITYTPSENITRWVKKFGEYNTVMDEATERKEELRKELSNDDKEMSDVLHLIEMTEKFDLFWAWKMVKKIKHIRQHRRDVKDEMMVLSSVLKKDIEYINMDVLNKTIEGLSHRKYRLRIVEEDESV